MKEHLHQIAQEAIRENYKSYSHAARELGVPVQRISELMRRTEPVAAIRLVELILQNHRWDIYQ